VGQLGIGGVGAGFGPPLSGVGDRRWLRGRGEGIVGERGVPAEGECAVDQGLMAADPQVRAGLEVGPAEFVFDLFVALLDPVPQTIDPHDLG